MTTMGAEGTPFTKICKRYPLPVPGGMYTLVILVSVHVLLRLRETSGEKLNEKNFNIQSESSGDGRRWQEVAEGGRRILVVTFRDQVPTIDLVRLEKDLDSCNHIWVGFGFRSTTNHNQRASILCT